MNRLTAFYPTENPPWNVADEDGMTPEQVEALWTITVWRESAHAWKRRAEAAENSFWASLAANVGLLFVVSLLVWQLGT